MNREGSYRRYSRGIYNTKFQRRRELIKALKVVQNLTAIHKEENLIFEMGIQVRFNWHHEGGSDDGIQRSFMHTSCTSWKLGLGISNRKPNVS